MPRADATRANGPFRPGSHESRGARIGLVSLLAAGGVLLGGLARAPAALDPGGASWDSLDTALRGARHAARVARARLDPRAILEAERAETRVLAAAAEALARTPAPTRPAGAAFGFVLVQLVGARDPGARRWLQAFAPPELARIDSSGEVLFWAGVEALDTGLWQRAADCLQGRVPASLREYADWLGVRAVGEMDASRAGEVALSILDESPQHRFAGQLALRAGRQLLETGRRPEAQALLRHCLARHVLEEDLRAGLRTLLAETYRLAGDDGAFRQQFLIAAQTAVGSPHEAPLRLSQAWRILEGKTTPLPHETVTALRVILRLARSSEALTAYRRWAEALAAESRRPLLSSLLEALYRTRADDSLLALATEIRAARDRPSAVRAALYAGRVWRRRQEIEKLQIDYRAAASPDSGAALSAEERRDAALALWEMGRELQDAQRWEKAEGVFAELYARFPDEPNALEGAFQGALCLEHAGQRDLALGRLERLCREAPPSRTGAPCLWRALLRGDGNATRDLSRAVAEVNPGYYAFRARGELAAQAAGVAPGDSLGYWGALAAEVRDPAGWAWPERGGSAPAAWGDWLSRLESDPRADRGTLFLKLDHPEWAHDLWESIPGWVDLGVEARSALLRALGDTDAAIRAAIKGGSSGARYPIAHAAEVAEAAERFQLSPGFLFAVMRQESLLNPLARSGAGARGLLQLMPATARRMADSLGWKGFDLSRPRDNVLLGACHLAELMDQTRGEVPVALAAYNAGLGRAHAWRRTARDADDFIERIGFPETRRFVRSVLMHYAFYRDLYPTRDAGQD